MKGHYIWFVALLWVVCSCKSSKVLYVSSVDYQAVRTEFGQPESVDAGAKILVEYFFNSDGVMQPVVYNLTPEILILDQTKSFVIMPDGSSVSYYDPTVHTTTTGNYSSETGSTTFNLGGIASALGVGGILGCLANATTVGSSHTEGIIRQNSVTITDQPQVMIGPKGCVAMSKAYQIKGLGKTAAIADNVVDVPMATSPVKFSVCVSYSLDDGATYEKLVTNMYVSSSIRIPVSGKKISRSFDSIYKMKPDALAENLFMFTMPNNIEYRTSDAMGDFMLHTNVYDTYIMGSLIDFQ